MRLDKYLALASIGTKKAVKGYIYQGKVAVNGSTNCHPADSVDENKDIISYLGKEINGTQKTYYMFHKPQGCITARSDTTDKTVFHYFNSIDTTGLFPIGRLDKDTEGLLLLTNDGDFSHSLMNPQEKIEKTYFFWAIGTIDEEKIQQIETGVDIGYPSITKPAKLRVTKRGDFCQLAETIQAEGCKITQKNLYHQKVVAGYLIISQGMKHQVKRMLKHIGCDMIYLKRVSIGNLSLDETLKKGEYRLLSEKELNEIDKKKENR